MQELEAKESERRASTDRKNSTVSIMGLHARKIPKVCVRAKVIEELLNTEVEYVKLLKNVIQVSE